MLHSFKKAIPNLLTLLRILGAAALLFLAPLKPPFLTVYAFCGFSDILDGFLARRWQVSSAVGALLDSIADFLLTAVLLYVFIPYFSWPEWILIWIASVALIRCSALSVCWVRFRQFAFLHTVSNKITGIALFCFPIFLWLLGLNVTAGILCGLASISALEELLIQIVSKPLNRDIPSILQIEKRSL
ncbi:MAG: CDP-alcohol phosphatidyltransferase family protein [Clostridiaceae bacterium]